MWGYSGTHPGDLGVHNARDTPSPKPAACPNPSAHSRASSTSPPAIDTERDASAGRCGAMRSGVERSDWAIAARDGPPQKARTSLPRLHMRLELRRHPWHWGTSLLGKTSDRGDAQRPWSALLIATRPLRHPLPLGRHAAARSRSARPRGRAVGIFAGGDKTRMIAGVPPEADNGAQAAF